MPDIHWKFVSASAVLPARTHNASIINVDFLKNKKIIPQDMQHDQSTVVITPVVAQLAFGKIRLSVDPERLYIEETSQNQESNCFPTSYMIYECAKQYVKTLPHIPYVAVGLNWTVQIFSENTVNWFKKRFLKKTARLANIVPTAFAFRSQDNDSYACTLTTTFDNHMPILNCNFHFPMIHNSDDNINRISSILDDADKYQRIFNNHIENYFCGEM